MFRRLNYIESSMVYANHLSDLKTLSQQRFRLLKSSSVIEHVSEFARLLERLDVLVAKFEHRLLIIRTKLPVIKHVIVVTTQARFTKSSVSLFRC